MQFVGKVALVTGGSHGIGRAIALRLGREGADVAINFLTDELERDSTAAEGVARQISEMGRKALVIEADVSRFDDTQRLVRTVVDSFGHIDILANNAGIVRRTPFLEIREAEWDRVIAVDLKGPFLVGQAVARHMVERGIAGRIINTASICAYSAAPGVLHYLAAKAGVYMLTRGMALELAPHGVLVNAIAPGVIETGIDPEGRADPARRAAHLARIPLGRFASPEEVAGTVAYLASDDSSFVTGTMITIDGGHTVR